MTGTTPPTGPTSARAARCVGGAARPRVRGPVDQPAGVHRYELAGEPRAESVVVLGTVLVAATAVLIPGQAEEALGVELLVVALVSSAAGLLLERNARVTVDDGRPAPPAFSLYIRRIFGLGAPFLLVVTAVTLVVEAGGGLYWWPAAIVFAYADRDQQRVVLLIEVLR